MKIFTSSWRTKLPDGYTRVGISRGAVRTPGFRRYDRLAPGPWFNSVDPQTYLKLYGEILARLDPQQVAKDISALGPNPTMLCYEAPNAVAIGVAWCHRHIAAQWLEDSLGVTVEEVGWPDLDRWAYLRARGLQPPEFECRTNEI